MQPWGFCLFLGFATGHVSSLGSHVWFGTVSGETRIPSPGCGGPEWCHPHLGMSTVFAAAWGGHLTLESWISWLCDLVLAKQTWMIMASGLKSFAQWKRFLAYTRIIHSSLERIQKLKRRYTRKWQHRCFHSAWEDLSISQAARGNHDYGIWGDPTRGPKEQKARTVGHVD